MRASSEFEEPAVEEEEEEEEAHVGKGW